MRVSSGCKVASKCNCRNTRNRPTNYNLQMVFDGIGDGVVVVGQDSVDTHI